MKNLRILFLALLPVTSTQPVFADVTIQVKLLLQGAYDSASGLMRDDLRNKNLLPQTQPYSSMPATYPGTETLHPDLLDRDGNEAVVDWVLVSLSTEDNPSSATMRRAVLLRRDGLLANPQSGATELVFSGLEPARYRVSVQHRNHLGITSVPLALEQLTTLVDFTAPQADDLTRYTSAGKAMLWAGDADTDAQIIASGPGNDINTVASLILSDAQNISQSANYHLQGYHNTDLNLDGSTLFAGPGTDINLLRANILLHPQNQTTSLNYLIRFTDTSTAQITLPGAVERALATGKASDAGTEELLQASLTTISANQTLLLQAKTKLFNLNADGSVKTDGSSLTGIDWDPTHDAALMLSTYGMNTPVLLTNAANNDKTIYEKEIGIIGEHAATNGNKARYMVLGSNPMRNYRRDNASINQQMHQFLENSLSWLTGRDDLQTAPFNVAIAHLDDGYYFPDERAVREWLDAHYSGQASYNAADTCDDAALEICLEAAPDLLIISQHQNEGSHTAALAGIVKDALERGTPVLYLHLDGSINALGRELFTLFNVTYHWDNYWKKLKLSAFNIQPILQTAPPDIQSVQTMLQHFKAADYAFDWSACDGENCSAVAGLDTEFQQGADTVRAMMNELDKNKTDLFAKPGFRLQKLLALLGDSYRQQVSFPLDKITSDDNEFLQAYFADHAVYNYRTINPVQPDMGNFSRSDFSHITPVTKTIDLQSKVSFRSAGVYALPGQTMSVTRLDNSDLTVKVFVNTQRSGSTHQWANEGYKRPKFLKSPQMDINSGETIRFTSPYGGPVQIAFSTNDLPVQLRFENVGEHPYWASSADDATFTTQLAAGHYDWAELVTPGFEVHSTLDKMRTSVSNWDNPANLAAKTMRHLHNFPHVLAGFQGPGIDQVAEIHDWATEKGLTIDTLDKVKHMNADQATCGYGCSGNPYDAYWSFSPIGHGDIHELGHGLEKGRFRFSGWEGHSTTNPYSYYSKTQYYKDTGGDPNCQNLPFESVFNTLQASINETDATSYLQNNLWVDSSWSHQVSMTIQMMMAAQYQGVLQDGWHLLARLHILEREFSRAKANEESWAARKASLGFADYTLEEAKAITNNDWLVIAVSQVTGLDYRAFIQTWGQDFSSKAAAQVAGFEYPPVQLRFFVSSADGYCRGEGFDGENVVLDGVQSWPVN